MACCTTGTTGPESPVGAPAVASHVPVQGASATVDKEFCEGPGKGWFDLRQMLEDRCYPYRACGDGGFRVPAVSIDVHALEGDHWGDELREDNVLIGLVADGSWSTHHTVMQEKSCVARLCGPGKISVESRYCFSELPVHAGEGVIQLGLPLLRAHCSPGRLPPGHYTATVDGISVEFDVPRKIKAGETIEGSRQLLMCRPSQPDGGSGPDAGSH